MWTSGGAVGFPIGKGYAQSEQIRQFDSAMRALVRSQDLEAGPGRDAPRRGAASLKNPNHEKLAREFAAGASQADAWRAIGRDPAKGNQCRTFARPEIQDRIAYLQEEFNRHAGISLAALQARLLRLADANVVDFFEADQATKRLRLRDLTTLPRVVTSSIAELQIDPKGAVKLKTLDRLHAIDSLIRTVGGFAPDDGDPERKGVTLEEMVLASMNQQGGASVKLEVVTGVPRAPDDPPLASSAPAVAPKAGANNAEPKPAKPAAAVQLVRL
jgi:hypothetical protein